MRRADAQSGWLQVARGVGMARETECGRQRHGCRTRHRARIRSATNHGGECVPNEAVPVPWLANARLPSLEACRSHCAPACRARCIVVAFTLAQRSYVAIFRSWAAPAKQRTCVRVATGGRSMLVLLSAKEAAHTPSGYGRQQACASEAQNVSLAVAPVATCIWPARCQRSALMLRAFA